MTFCVMFFPALPHFIEHRLFDRKPNTTSPTINLFYEAFPLCLLLQVNLWRNIFLKFMMAYSLYVFHTQRINSNSSLFSLVSTMWVADLSFLREHRSKVVRGLLRCSNKTVTVGIANLSISSHGTPI